MRIVISMMILFILHSCKSSFVGVYSYEDFESGDFIDKKRYIICERGELYKAGRPLIEAKHYIHEDPETGRISYNPDSIVGYTISQNVGGSRIVNYKTIEQKVYANYSGRKKLVCSLNPSDTVYVGGLFSEYYLNYQKDTLIDVKGNLLKCHIFGVFPYQGTDARVITGEPPHTDHSGEVALESSLFYPVYIRMNTQKSDYEVKLSDIEYLKGMQKSKFIKGIIINSVNDTIYQNKFSNYQMR